MEFPEIGSQCAFDLCKLNDFLPFTCQHCTLVFCKDHFNIISHKCKSNFDNTVLEAGKSFKNYVCSKDDCKSSSPVEMNCQVCKKHFCLEHRWTCSCLEESPEDISKRLKEWEKPKEEFKAVKTIVDAKIDENLKKAKNPATAYKVRFYFLTENKIVIVFLITTNILTFLGAIDETKRSSCWIQSNSN